MLGAVEKHFFFLFCALRYFQTFYILNKHSTIGFLYCGAEFSQIYRFTTIKIQSSFSILKTAKELSPKHENHSSVLHCSDFCLVQVVI